MRKQFIPVMDRRKALRMFDFPTAKVVKVCGGYLGFESVNDFEVWRKQK